MAQVEDPAQRGRSLLVHLIVVVQEDWNLLASIYVFLGFLIFWTSKRK